MKHFLPLLLLLSACKVSKVTNLYNSNDPLYNSIKDAAAKECATTTELFNSMKLSSFNSAQLNEKFEQGNYINISGTYGGSSKEVIIHLETITDTSVTFSVISGSTSATPPVIADQKYTISLPENNKIAELLAIGICNKSYGNIDPSSYKNSLEITATRYYIKDSTDVTSSTVPTIYEKREDRLRLDKTIPAFLTVFLASYVHKVKATSEGSESAGNYDYVVDSYSFVTECSGSCSIGTGSVPLTANSDDYKYVRSSSSDKAVTSFYFNKLKN
ncbi:MAG: hypothetical protein N4A33_01540 [Bacteriovoracaceae bacterium]|nr:hypothetical protein [Bacteriovoracaceae bacterium]